MAMKTIKIKSMLQSQTNWSRLYESSLLYLSLTHIIIIYKDRYTTKNKPKPTKFDRFCKKFLRNRSSGQTFVNLLNKMTELPTNAVGNLFIYFFKKVESVVNYFTKKMSLKNIY